MNPSTSADVKLFNAFVRSLPGLISVSIDKLHILCGHKPLQDKFFALIPPEDRTLSEHQLENHARHLSRFRQKYRAEFERHFLRRATLIHSSDIAASINEFRAAQLVTQEGASQVGHAHEHRLIDRLASLCGKEFHHLDALLLRYQGFNKNSLPNAINPTTLGTSLADAFLRTPFRQQHSQAGVLYLVFLFAHEVRKQLRILSSDFSQAMELEEFDAMQHAPQFQPFLPTIPFEFGD